MCYVAYFLFDLIVYSGIIGFLRIKVGGFLCVRIFIGYFSEDLFHVLAFFTSSHQFADCSCTIIQFRDTCFLLWVWKFLQFKTAFWGLNFVSFISELDLMLGSCYVKSDLSDRYRDSFSNKLTWYSLDVICRAHGSPRQILTNSARRLIKTVATLMKFRSFIKS